MMEMNKDLPAIDLYTATVGFKADGHIISQSWVNGNDLAWKIAGLFRAVNGLGKADPKEYVEHVKKIEERYRFLDMLSEIASYTAHYLHGDGDELTVDLLALSNLRGDDGDEAEGT